MLYKKFTEEEVKELYMTDGYDMGFEQGEKSGKKEVAAALKAKDVDRSIIAECTGLSIEEIDNI